MQAVASGLKLFFLTHHCDKSASVFVPSKMFGSKAGTQLNGAAGALPQGYDPGHTHKHWTRLERPQKAHTHSSLFGTVVSYKERQFYNIGHWCLPSNQNIYHRKFENNLAYFRKDELIIDAAGNVGRGGNEAIANFCDKIKNIFERQSKRFGSIPVNRRCCIRF